jgi:hypothetical protein
METLCSNYLPFGAKVRRRQVPGEPGDRTVGWIAGGTLDGRKHFVMWGHGSNRRMELQPTGEIEQISGREA